MARDQGMSAISLVSYDYRFLLTTIPKYLPFVDELLLGVDGEGLTWSGQRFEIPPSFFEELRQLDERPAKIRVIARPFYSAARSPMENDTAERNALSLEARPGNWLVSIDADECLLNPKAFFGFLGRLDKGADVDVDASWISSFKDLGESLLVVAAHANGGLERFPIATMRRGAFVTSRRTAAKAILSPGVALHYSWGRTAEELLQKLRNWSHTRDFDVEKFFEFWQGVNKTNYSAVRRFHPIWPEMWSRLVRVEKEDLENWDLWDLGQKGGSRLGRMARRLWRRRRRMWRAQRG